jgi:hypothetical protein
VNNASTSGQRPQPTLEDLRRRHPGWDVQGGRDGFPLYSGLFRPSESALVYIVAHDVRTLAAMIERYEDGGQ